MKQTRSWITCVSDFVYFLFRVIRAGASVVCSVSCVSKLELSRLQTEIYLTTPASSLQLLYSLKLSQIYYVWSRNSAEWFSSPNFKIMAVSSNNDHTGESHVSHFYSVSKQHQLYSHFRVYTGELKSSNNRKNRVLIYELITLRDLPFLLYEKVVRFKKKKLKYIKMFI